MMTFNELKAHVNTFHVWLAPPCVCAWNSSKHKQGGDLLLTTFAQHVCMKVC